jgi:hypothetical protein
MPTYEFECHNGHVTERMVPMGTKVIECPTCLELGHAFGTVAHRILSPTGTTFKFADGAGK